MTVAGNIGENLVHNQIIVDMSVLMMQRVDGANMPWLASDNGITDNAEGMFLTD